MGITEQTITGDLRVCELNQVSREHGRARLKTQEEKGEINPKRTSTGRRYRSVADGERLATAL
jgi:hypothetical protein